MAAGSNVVPLYAMLYTFSQVAVQRKYDSKTTIETLKSIIRSSSFIFFHVYNGSLVGCALRNSFGRFYFRVLVWAPAIVSSYLSLMIEKPERRQALAFYLLNLASEIVYRMAVTKGYFKPVKRGETLVFALSLAVWLSLLKTRGGASRDPISVAVKMLIGRDELRSAADEQRRRNSCLVAPSCCPHKQTSCLYYIVEPIPTRFLLGYSIQTLLKLAAKPLDLIQKPSETLKQSLTSPSSIKFGLFLASLVSSARLTGCVLRRVSNSQSQLDEKHLLGLQGAATGFVAGLSMLLAPRSSISMYVMWKAVEQYFFARDGHKTKSHDEVPTTKRAHSNSYRSGAICTIYAISAATILYSFALEPRFVRPSYMKFLDRVSDHRLHQLNRLVLDVFGTGSSIGYEDYFPDLHPKYMSNQFKELVFNWVIQPFE